MSPHKSKTKFKTKAKTKAETKTKFKTKAKAQTKFKTKTKTKAKTKNLSKHICVLGKGLHYVTNKEQGRELDFVVFTIPLMLASMIDSLRRDMGIGHANTKVLS